MFSIFVYVTHQASKTNCLIKILHELNCAAYIQYIDWTCVMYYRTWVSFKYLYFKDLNGKKLPPRKYIQNCKAYSKCLGDHIMCHLQDESWRELVRASHLPQIMSNSCKNQRFLLPKRLKYKQKLRCSAVLHQTNLSSFSFSSWDLDSLKLSPVFWDPTRNRPIHPAWRVEASAWFFNDVWVAH